MSIYDEAKAIKHEEMLKELEGFFHMYGSNDVLRKFRKYVLEQQAKEKRAKKEYELLELYKQQKKDREENSLSSTTLYWVIEKEIAIKEKELEKIK